ncbi:MAG: hypothetical protein H6712_27175 [Myxococcales bacterium]|nr:hypothetical protein [Myxococcales bacterium]MCB9717560.1 hypothetical protein [Myxococcales bacterium]
MPGKDIGALATELARSLSEQFSRPEALLEPEGMAELDGLTKDGGRYTELGKALELSRPPSEVLREGLQVAYRSMAEATASLGKRVESCVTRLRTPNEGGLVLYEDRVTADRLAEWGRKLEALWTTVEVDFQTRFVGSDEDQQSIPELLESLPSWKLEAILGRLGFHRDESGEDPPDADPAVGFMREHIDHVIVVMLENRGFDHVLGMLYDTANDDEPLRLVPDDDELYRQHSTAVFEGLAGLPLDACVNTYEDVSTGPILGARSPKTPRFNPHEDFVHILAQMYDVAPAKMTEAETRNPLLKPEGVYLEPTMTGYVRDYVDSIAHHGKVEDPPDDDIREVMEMYLPEQLPVLNGLARSFAVSDMWFCSVPSQTNTNRAYYLSGTARGLVTNTFYEPESLKQHADSLPADTSTVFDLLDKADWMYFWQAKWPPLPKDVARYNQYLRYMFPNYQSTAYNDNFAKLEDFVERAEQGRLPKLSVIEPAWGGGDVFRHRYVSPMDLQRRKFSQGNDMHPPSQLTQGEDLIRRIYEAAFIRGKDRDRTMLIITFDENGGTFDHFPPPAATPIPSIEDSPTRHERAPEGHEGPNMDDATGTQFGFEFDMYGIRVPTIVVAPYVAPGTVFRSSTPGLPLDHTSLISTILAWRGIPRENWSVLGSRVATAPIFANVLQSDARDMRKETEVFHAMPTRDEEARPVADGDQVYLRYVGSRWPAPPLTRLYVGPFHQTNRFSKLFPTLGPLSRAVPLTVQRRSPSRGKLRNGEEITLTSTEEGMNGYSVLGAWTTTAEAYYHTSNPRSVSDNQTWLLELFATRNPGEQIYYGDEVTFTNKSFSPQRLIATDGKDYLTTNDGEWAIWVIEPAS